MITKNHLVSGLAAVSYQKRELGPMIGFTEKLCAFALSKTDIFIKIAPTFKASQKKRQSVDELKGRRIPLRIQIRRRVGVYQGFSSHVKMKWGQSPP